MKVMMCGECSKLVDELNDICVEYQTKAQKIYDRMLGDGFNYDAELVEAVRDLLGTPPDE